MTTKSENPLRQKDGFPAPGSPENVSPDSRSENARGEPFPALPCILHPYAAKKTALKPGKKFNSGYSAQSS